MYASAHTYTFNWFLLSLIINNIQSLLHLFVMPSETLEHEVYYIRPAQLMLMYMHQMKNTGFYFIWHLFHSSVSNLVETSRSTRTKEKRTKWYWKLECSRVNIIRSSCDCLSCSPRLQYCKFWGFTCRIVCAVREYACRGIIGWNGEHNGYTKHIP